MGIPGSANPMLFGGAAAYQINQSLRFNSADSAYLNRTPASAGNRKTWTWSGWVKRTTLSEPDPGTFLFGAGANTGNESNFYLRDTNVFQWRQIVSSSQTSRVTTTQVFRDVSGWYHFVVACDTTQATASNRLKLFVNGIQVDAFSDTSYPSQNSDTFVNSTDAHYIGKRTVDANYCSAYLAEVNFIDGTALTPSSFGETDAITGAWIPKKYSGSYGTNGFYLKFEGSGIGTDSSGNGNTWTANNFSTSGTGTDVMSDTPTNNWCTLNPLNQDSAFTLSDGNLRLTSTANTSSVGVTSTSAVYSGKWYWEITRNSWNINCGISLITTSSPRSSAVTGSGGQGVSYLGTNIYKDGSSVQSGLSNMVDGDVAGIALNLDSNTVQFYRNGSALGTAVSISAETWTPSFGMDTGGYGANVTTTFNFGQRAFAYTPPTGFKALSTGNLPEPTIKKGGKYFDTVLYTGNGSTRTITGVGFQPDLVWIKRRDGAANHGLYDSVRGATKALVSSSTGAEVTDTGALTSFDADGFSLGAAVTTAPNVNTSGQTYVAWAWDANGAGSSNTAGSITSTVSANASAGFSIVTYTGTGSNATVGHGLGVAPSMMIVKNRSAAAGWIVYHKFANASPATGGLRLNLTDAFVTYSLYWNNTEPNSSVFTLGSESQVNGNTNQMLAYCFSEVAGYSKFGSYTGNGSSDGPFVACNFRPRWLLIKRTDSANDWVMKDAARNSYNTTNLDLYANTSQAEVTFNEIDFTSNGFKIRNSNASTNASGGTYVFAAFSETAFKFANAR